MKLGCSWGAAVAVVVCSGAAFAQVPGTSGAASGGSTGTAGAASAAAPTPTETAPAPEAPAEAAPPAAPPAAAPATADESEDEAEEAPRKKKPKSKKRRRFFDDDARRRDDDREREDYREGEDNEEREEASEEEGREEQEPAAAWRLRGPHFVFSAERVTSILGWNQKMTTESEGFGPSGPVTQTQERTVSGTDVSLLGAGGFAENPLGVPRIGFDYIFSGGFSLGGSLSYLVTSGETEISGSDDGSGSSTSSTSDRPTVAIGLFAPRVGGFLEASPQVAVWLRGGITRLVASSEGDGIDINGNSTKVTSTLSFWDLTLDPQLVLSPAPHVAITVGVTLDIGLSGTAELENGANKRDNDVTASSYGVTSGLVALF